MLFSGCAAVSVSIKPALRENGEIVLYSQPLPQEAHRLRFQISQIFAVKDDGAEHPLNVFLSDFKTRNMKRQRLVASGELPPGPYKGLSINIRKASLKNEEGGEAALLVPEEPVKIDFPFYVSKKKSSLLSLALNYRKSIRNGFLFSPAFSFYVPDKPVIGLVGLAANYGANLITVFDKKRMLAVRVIATGRGPRGVALDQGAKRAYAAVSGEDAVEVIDLQSEDIIDRIRLNTGDAPQEPALTPDGRLLLTTNTNSDTVSVIDPVSLIELSRIRVGDGPNSTLIDRTGRRAFVFNTLSSSISVIDLPSRSLAVEISTDSAPIRGQFNRREDRLFVIHERTPYLTVVDTASLVQIDRVFVGRGMSSLKIDINTDQLYLGRKHARVVDVYNAFSLLPVDSIMTGGGTAYMTIDGEENNLYLINPEKKTLVIVDLISKKMVSEIDVGEGPYWVTMMGER
jgi:YVTN family beta-propeller protein